MRAARSLLVFVAAVILLPAASPRTLVAQQSCRALLRADATTPPPWLVADPELTIQQRWLPVFLPYLSDVVHDWDSTQAFWPVHEIDTTRFPLETVTASLRTARDSQLAAVALVSVMRGESGGSFSSAHVQAAALLYQALALPPGPAVALLRRVDTPTLIKVPALGILESLVTTREVKEATRAAVCALAAKMDGLARVSGITASSGSVFLSDEETWLLSNIAYFLSIPLNDDPDRDHHRDQLFSYLTAGLPSRNVVTRFLRDYFYCCR
jgi:hypothetical protein